MKQRTARCWIPVGLALTFQLVLSPGAGRASEPSPASPLAVRDVALDVAGRLLGRVIDASGHPVSGVTVWVQADGEWIATAISGPRGEFVVSELARGRVVHLVTQGGAAVYRCWVDGTSPPGASKQAVVVVQPELMRGQRPISELFFGDPLVAGLAVAAAVAIPVAVVSSKKSRAPGS